jgi:hypothetical protein
LTTTSGKNSPLLPKIPIAQVCAFLSPVWRTKGASRSEKLGRGGAVSEISETSYCHPAGANPA